MKRRVKQTSKLYAYLEKTNVLSGTDEDIRAAKREYRRRYQAAWRKAKRAANQEITVTFSQQELRTITQAAKRHRLARPRFVKLAALAYLNNSFVVPDILAVNSIQEYLIMIYSAVQKLFDENKVSYATSKELLQKIAMLETTVLTALKQPERIEDIMAAEMQKNPALAQTLRELLKTFQP